MTMNLVLSAFASSPFSLLAAIKRPLCFSSQYARFRPVSAVTKERKFYE